MARKASIYLTDNISAILGHADNLSGRIATICTRYRDIVAEATPELTIAEWSAICDALNGAALLDDFGGADTARWIWAEIADCRDLGAKWAVDQNALAHLVRELPLAGKIGVAEVAARFWASPRLNAISNGELLVEAGARVVAAPIARA